VRFVWLNIVLFTACLLAASGIGRAAYLYKKKRDKRVALLKQMGSMEIGVRWFLSCFSSSFCCQVVTVQSAAEKKDTYAVSSTPRTAMAPKAQSEESAEVNKYCSCLSSFSKFELDFRANAFVCLLTGRMESAVAGIPNR